MNKYLLILLVSCGIHGKESSPELAIYNEMIKEEAATYGITMRPAPAILVDEFSDKSIDLWAIGVCYTPLRTIEIKREYWDVASDEMRYSLMLHEQGHCAFRLDHVEGTIMNKSSIYPTEELIEQYWEMVLDRIDR